MQNKECITINKYNPKMIINENKKRKNFLL